MVLHTTARHFNLAPETRAYGEEKIRGLARYFDQIYEGSLTITREKSRFEVEISLHVGGGADLVSSGESSEPMAAIDGAIERLERQVKKHKGRLIDRRSKGEKVGPVLAQEAERASDVGDEGADR